MSTKEFLQQKLKSVPPYFSSKALSDKQMQSRIKKISPQLTLAIVGNACKTCIYTSRKKIKKKKKSIKSGCKQMIVFTAL